MKPFVLLMKGVTVVTSSTKISLPLCKEARLTANDTKSTAPTTWPKSYNTKRKTVLRTLPYTGSTSREIKVKK
jgi:hypothetical protein